MSMFKQKRLTTYMSRRDLSSSLTDCHAVVMNVRSTRTLVVYQYDVVLHQYTSITSTTNRSLHRFSPAELRRLIKRLSIFQKNHRRFLENFRRKSMFTQRLSKFARTQGSVVNHVPYSEFILYQGDFNCWSRIRIRVKGKKRHFLLTLTTGSHGRTCQPPSPPHSGNYRQPGPFYRGTVPYS